MLEPTDYCVEFGPQIDRDGMFRLVYWVYDRVCRFDFSSRGFLLVRLSHDFDSRRLRSLMVEFKQKLSMIHVARTRRRLVYTFLGRFDQQHTTRLHRDGGPEESILMLGYEPTSIQSRLSVADYTRCAYDMGIEPKLFLAGYNPMYAEDQEALAAYTTEVEGFDPARFQILAINNSMLPFREDKTAMQGVLHQVEIIHPSPTARRIVNSTMIAAVDPGMPEPVSAAEQEEFQTSDGSLPNS